MTRQQLIEFYEKVEKAGKRLAAARSELKEAEEKYMESNGLELGQRVMIKQKYSQGKIGIISKRRMSEDWDIDIYYRVHKITKSGKAHKTAAIRWWISADELEIIEDGEVKK